MKQKSLLLLKDTSYYLTNFFPIAFCMAVLFGFGANIGIIFSLLLIFFAPDIKNDNMLPILISFLILGKNTGIALTSSLICAVLLIISSFFYEKLKNYILTPVVSGVILSGALTLTVLFTTNYFGIGATGNNVTEMIKSYISLGFHPNWRGVLFGTIVLVIMITFPRKFKNSSQYICPAFFALVFTLILNLFLNPSHMVSAVNEIKYDDISMIKDYFFSKTELIFNFKSILIGFTLFIIYFYSIANLENSNKTDYIFSGIANVFSSGIIGLPLPCGINKNIKNMLPRLLAAAIILITFATLKEYILRIPVHSCAVVIIVSAWQSVKWKEIKNSFANLFSFICFILSIIICLLSDMAYGIFVSTVIFSCIFYLKQNKNIKTCN